jgi:hypothetical protein
LGKAHRQPHVFREFRIGDSKFPVFVIVHGGSGKKKAALSNSLSDVIVFADMKTLLKLCCVVMVLLFLLTACNLDQISVRWTVDATTWLAPTVTVDYTVWNDGAYDLTGVNLEIGISTTLGDVISDWTPDFSLNKGETKTGTFFLNTGVETPTGAATILGVRMDNPKDS